MWRVGYSASRGRACQALTSSMTASVPEEIKVGELPAFYGNGFDQRVVRFCFAKKDETLNAALQRLSRL